LGLKLWEAKEVLGGKTRPKFKKKKKKPERYGRGGSREWDP